MNSTFNAKIRTAAVALVAALIFTAIPPNMSMAADAKEEKSIVCEMTQLRNEYTKTYLQSDGSYIAVTTEEPQHYKKGGKWEDIDNTLETKTDGEGKTVYRNKANSYTANLPETLAEPVTVQKGGQALSIQLVGAEKSNKLKKMEAKQNKKSGTKIEKEIAPENKTTSAEYANVMEDTNITYDVQPSALKESIVLNKKPSENTVYVYEIDAGTLNAVLNSDNSIDFFASNNENATYTMPAPFMFDGTDMPAYSQNVAVALDKKSDGVYTLTYKPDNTWLKDKARVYPVTIDPTVQTGGSYTVNTSYVSQSSPGSCYTTATEMLTSSSSPEFISYFSVYGALLSVPFGEGVLVTKAQLTLTSIQGNGSVVGIAKTATMWPDNVTYNTRPTLSEDYEDYQTVSDLTTFDITRAVQTGLTDFSYGYALKMMTPAGTQPVKFCSNNSPTNKPYIAIEYRNMTGNGRYSNHSIDMGRAGVAAINDVNGNMTITTDDIGIDGNVMPVSIRRIYDTTERSDRYGFSTMWKTNYHQSITYDTARQLFEYKNGDGKHIYFKSPENQEDGNSLWKDEDEEGYELTASTASPSAYTGVKLKGTDGYTYTFNSNGYLTKITDESQPAMPCITITYLTNTTLPHIDLIKDGAGRKYKFNYTTITTGYSPQDVISSIDFLYGASTTPIQTMHYDYTISQDPGVSILSSVTYPDTKIVHYYVQDNTYSYIGNAVDIDGREFHFSNQGFFAPVYHVMGVQEFGNDGTPGDSLTMSYQQRQTTFTDSQGNVAIYQFDQDGNITCTRDQDGNAVSASYNAANGQLQGISEPIVSSSENNLATNGFYYIPDTGVTVGTHDNSIPILSGKTYQKIQGTYDTGTDAVQTIIGPFQQGDMFSFGGWFKGLVMPSDAEEDTPASRYVKIEIQATRQGATESENIATLDINPYIADWQYQIQDFTLEFDCPQLIFDVIIENQPNQICLSQMELKKQPRYTYVNGENGPEKVINTEPTPTTTVSRPIDRSKEETDTYGRVTQSVSSGGVGQAYEYDDYGNVLKSSVTNGRSSIDTVNTYTSNYADLASTTDPMGTKLEYSVSSSMGTISRIITPSPCGWLYYSYDAMLNMTNARTSANGGIPYAVDYTYENDRMKTIACNGTQYTYGYNSFGDLSSVKVGAGRTLVSYGYKSNNNRILNAINYGNGQSVNYTYDSRNQLLSDGKYTYTYDQFGTLTQKSGQGTVTRYEDDIVRVYDAGGVNMLYAYVQDGDKLLTTVGTTKTETNATYDNDRKLLNTSLKRDTTDIANFENRYDDLGRLTNKGVYSADKRPLVWQNYLYKELPGNKSTEQIQAVDYTFGSQSTSFNNFYSYTYDALGNIKTISKNGQLQATYTYGGLGELKRMDDAVQNKTFTYSYDQGHNLTYKDEYAYTTGTLGTRIDRITYAYGDTEWKDLLTSYDGKAITYDTIGNPLSYDGWTYNWQNGRELSSMNKSGLSISYTYDENGMRLSKNADGTEHKYMYADGKLISEQVGSNMIYYSYDGDGEVASINYGGVEYYYVKNTQGDIIGIVDNNGTLVVEYGYDAWGKETKFTCGQDYVNLAYANPFRYRGYYYDYETGLYYLQSRYYNPEWGRFINADDTSVLEEQQGELMGANLFAYCSNNPVTNADPTGYKSKCNPFKGQDENAGTGNRSGGIYDISKYLKDRYGEEYNFDSKKEITLSQTVTTGDFSAKGSCSIVALTNVLFYLTGGRVGYKVNGQIKYKTISIEDMFWDIVSVGSLSGYLGGAGTIPYTQGEIARKYLNSIFNKKYTAYDWGLWDLDRMKYHLNGGRPFMLNITSGYYGGHSITVTGYRIYKSKKKDRKGKYKYKTFLTIKDGWTKDDRYIDISQFGSGQTTTYLKLK